MHRRHAFSLLEMSIVIVIIGLLTGGLVAGRNYIRNAELTSIVNESKYYINLFGQFEQKYGYAPGDFPTASSEWTGAFDGNGNGRITSSLDVGEGTGPLAEIFYAFQHLNRAKMIDGSYTGATSTAGPFAAEPRTNIPALAFKNAALIFDFPGETDANLNGEVTGSSLYFDGFYPHIIRVAGIGPSATTLPQDPILTPEDALSLDTKFDDGRPGLGWIMTPSNTALASCATSDMPTTADYNTTIYTNACYLILKVQ